MAGFVMLFSITTTTVRGEWFITFLVTGMFYHLLIYNVRTHSKWIRKRKNSICNVMKQSSNCCQRNSFSFKHICSHTVGNQTSLFILMIIYSNSCLVLCPIVPCNVCYGLQFKLYYRNIYVVFFYLDIFSAGTSLQLQIFGFGGRSKLAINLKNES